MVNSVKDSFIEVRLSGPEMIALEKVLRAGRRLLPEKIKRTIKYHSDIFTQEMIESRVVKITPGGFEPQPGTALIKFSIARLRKIYIAAETLQEKRVILSRHLDSAIKKLKNHDR